MTLTILDDTGNYREIDLAAKKIFAGGLTNPSAWDTMAATKARWARRNTEGDGQ